MEEQYPDTDLVAYCRKCREGGGCDPAKGQICPQPTLLPECLPAVHAYDTCKTQWRVGMGGHVGLDYTACIDTLQLYLPQWNKERATVELALPELMDDLRTIEGGLLDGLADKAQKKRDNENKGDE